MSIADLQCYIAILALEHARLHPEADTAIITLGVEKAFDNINLQWLFLVMRKFGFEGPVLEFVKSIYLSTMALLVLPGSILDLISLMRGTGQGCSLSLLLLNLAIEPLSWILTMHSQLSCIRIGGSLCGWRFLPTTI